MRKKVIVRVNDERQAALTWLKLVYKISHDDEVYDLAFDQLFQATRTLEERVKKETPNLIKEIANGTPGEVRDDVSGDSISVGGELT